MNRHSITKENLLATLPIALRTDPSVVALTESLAAVLADRTKEIDRLRIYPAIDKLDELLLDILAYDFKVDWWDLSYTLEEKRRTLKDSWRVHKTLGTKAAVETAISAIYPNTRVLEWFEYGGEPYHFKLDINITNDSIDSAKQKRVLERMNFYKSLRSHNDGVTYFVEALPAIAKAGVCMPGIWEDVHTSLELSVPLIRPIVSARVGAITGIWEEVTTQKLELPTSAVKSQAMVRIGSMTGVCENFTACLDLSVSDINQMVSVGLGTMTGFYEEFMAQMVLPDGTPTRSVAQLWTALASTWHESYVTEAGPLIDKVLTATTQAQAKSVIASTQEIAKTHINLQEVDYGETE